MMKSKTHFFDTRAENWEETCYPAPVRERLLDLIREFDIGSGERILDVGTGPGILLPYLRQGVGPSGQVCAFDLSIDMVRQANAKPHRSQDLIFRADVHSILFTNGVFDRVICFAAFPHFDNPGQAVQEMARVVKTGGALIFAHLMSRKELAAHHGSHATVAHDVLPPDPQMKALFEHLYRPFGCDGRLCFSGEWGAATCVGSTDHRKTIAMASAITFTLFTFMSVSS